MSGSLGNLPKAVLHDHLDGSLRVSTILELADEHGYGGLPATGAEALENWFDQGRSGSLESYLESFTHTIMVMQTEAAIERVAYESVVDLAADGVIYAEIRFAPSLNTVGGLSRHQAISAALTGLKRGENATGISTGLIVDAMRNDTDADEVVAVAIDFADEGVVGFDLAGPEDGFPPDLHRDACLRAVRHLRGVTIHAGEADGPDSIRRALDLCGAQRIGHGIHIVEDCRVVDGEIVDVGLLAGRILENQVPLEICVTSNLHTHGWLPEQHPIGMLYRAGFAVTLNTDNRLMSATSMSEEFALVADHHGFTQADLRNVTENTLRAAFVSSDEVQRLLDRVNYTP